MVLYELLDYTAPKDKLLQRTKPLVSQEKANQVSLN